MRNYLFLNDVLFDFILIFFSMLCSFYLVDLTK